MEQEKNKKKWMAVLGRYKYVLIVVAAGVVCLLWPGFDTNTEATTAETTSQTEMAATDLAAIQTEMEEILGKIQGVGQLELMLTVDTGTERVLAGDTSLSYSGATAAPDDYSRTTETVVVSNGGGEDQVVVTREVYPKFRGALVVCQGASDPTVQLRVLEAVSALTGLGSDKISIVQAQG